MYKEFSKLSIMLTSPAVPYALAAVKIEPSAIFTGNYVVLWWDRGGFAVGKIAAAGEA